ncbi:MAG: hypothetical protein ACREEG_04860, partial [Phenylobacterium sp.]
KTMKTTLFAAAAALSVLAAAPAFAQAPAAPAPAAPAAAGALSVENTPIETIVANPAGKAVLDKDLPGLTTHEAYDQFKAMTLAQVAPMSQGAITPEALKTVQADLDKIGK